MTPEFRIMKSDASPMARLVALQILAGVTDLAMIAVNLNTSAGTVARYNKIAKMLCRSATQNGEIAMQNGESASQICDPSRARSCSEEKDTNKLVSKKSGKKSGFPDYVETAYKDISKVYPKALGGKPIKEKLHKLLADNRELAQTIITAINQGRGRKRAPDGSLAPWPNFSTWLTQQRWEEEPLPQPKPKKTPAEELAELMGEDLEDEENGHGTANGSAISDLDQGRSDVGDMPSLFSH